MATPKRESRLAQKSIDGTPLVGGGSGLRVLVHVEEVLQLFWMVMQTVHGSWLLQKSSQALMNGT